MARANAFRLRTVSLAAAILWFLPGTQVQALPLGPATSIGPQATVTSTLTVTAVPTAVAFPDSLGSLAPAFDADPRGPELFFSFTLEGAGSGIVISIRNGDLVGSNEPRIEDRAGEALAGRVPMPPSTAALLFSSGMVSAGAIRRRRRGSRRLNATTTPSRARKEVSSKAPEAPSRSTCGSSYSTPLRI